MVVLIIRLISKLYYKNDNVPIMYELYIYINFKFID